MKIKLTLIIYSVISLLGLLLLLSRENIFVVAALLLSSLLLWYREIWSLIRYRRLPVIDERVRNNLTGAARITGAFFFIASLILILLLRFDVFENVSTSLVVSGLLVTVSLVYPITYLYYDRVLPNLGIRALRWFKIFLLSAGLSLSTIAFSITAHNMVDFLFHIEEAFFFILGLLIAPAVFGLSLLCTFFLYFLGLSKSPGRGELQ